MCLIKTWANSWSTSERYHEAIRHKCILGCNDKDELRHYLVCPPFWAMLNSAARAPHHDWDCSPPENLRLVGASVDRVKRICVVFRCYHAICISHHRVDRAAHETDYFEDLHVLFLELARYFCSEVALYQVR